ARGHERAEPGELDRRARVVIQGEGGIGADREVRADGEVRETQEPPEEGERDGGEGEDAARHDGGEDGRRGGGAPAEGPSARSDRQGLTIMTSSDLPFRTCCTLKGAERMSPIWSKSHEPDAPS